MLQINKTVFENCQTSVEFSDRLYEFIFKSIGVDGPYTLSSKEPIEEILEEIVGKADAAYWRDARFHFESRWGGKTLSVKSLIH